MTKNKARKRAARELARQRGVPYTRALREVGGRRGEDPSARPEDDPNGRPPTPT